MKRGNLLRKMEEKFYKHKSEDEGEEQEYELMEFSIDDEEINEFIDKLQNLKETKEKIHFDIDEENSLLINYEESDEEEDEGEESQDKEAEEEINDT